MDAADRARALAQIESDEGRRKMLYRDSRGYLSIGVGRLLDPRKGGKLRDSEIDLMLENDYSEAEGECESAFSWFSGLNPPRQAALVNMCFQLGLPKLLGFRRMLQALRDAHWADARHHALDSEWAKQTPDRARRVAYQLETGEWQ